MAGRKGMKGENLGGSRPGAGRNAKWFRAQKDEKLRCEIETIGGEIQEPVWWNVLSISEDEIEFQCGNDIIVIRRHLPTTTNTRRHKRRNE